jgi:hypothetical protein
MERTRMNTKRSVTWGLLAAAAACAAVAAMPGCELLVDFDRSKIPTGDASFGDDVTESPDAPAALDGASESSTPDAAADGAPAAKGDGGDAGLTPETGTPDTGVPDTGIPDTGSDTGIADTGPDTSNEVDSGVDSGPDATDDAGDGS